MSRDEHAANLESVAREHAWEIDAALGEKKSIPIGIGWDEDPDENLWPMFHPISRTDLENLPPPEPLICDLIPAYGVTELSGSRGLGKSLLALDWAACIATGRDWNHWTVAKHGHVLSVSLEGFPGIPERVRAWERHHDTRIGDDNLTWLRDRIDLKDPVWAVALGDYAAHLGSVAVLIDSARAAGTGREDTDDMSRFTAGCEKVAELSKAAVIVLHNAGWDGSRGRGSTTLPDGVDTVLHLDGSWGPDGVRSLTHQKYRDGVPLTTGLPFVFRGVQGTESGVLVPADPNQGGRTTLTNREKVLAAVIQHPGSNTSVIAAKAEVPRTTTATLLGALTADGLVHNDGTEGRPRWRPVNPEEQL